MEFHKIMKRFNSQRLRIRQHADPVNISYLHNILVSQHIINFFFLSKRLIFPKSKLNPICSIAFNALNLYSFRWDIEEELWDKEWNQLSGGEIQRISLSIALSCKPDLLLLDGKYRIVLKTCKKYCFLMY